MNMQQDQAPTRAQFRYVVPGLMIAGLGVLFSAGAGTYVGMNSPGEITLLVMQAFLVYSFPHVLLAAVGFFAYYINKLKLLAFLFAVSAAVLSGTVVTVTLRSLNGQGGLVRQLDAANITAFTVGLAVAVPLCVTLIAAAKLIRPKKPRQDDFLPF